MATLRLLVVLEHFRVEGPVLNKGQDADSVKALKKRGVARDG